MEIVGLSRQAGHESKEGSVGPSQCSSCLRAHQGRSVVKVHESKKKTEDTLCTSLGDSRETEGILIT